MPNDYAMVREKRKGPKITMGKGMQRVEPQDPMTGVTDPRKLLRSNTQRIDKNVITPEQMWQGSPKTGMTSEFEGERIKTT